MVALVLYLLLVVFGLSLLTTSTVFNILLTGMGVVVLAYLAYGSFRDFLGGVQIDLSPGDVQSTRHFVPGIVLTLSNPAVLVLWTGIMGADLATSSATVGEGLLLSLGILIGVAIFFSALTVLIHYGRQWLRPEHFKYVSLVAGIVLLYFCLRFAYELVASFL